MTLLPTNPNRDLPLDIEKFQQQKGKGLCQDSVDMQYIAIVFGARKKINIKMTVCTQMKELLS